MRLAGKAHVTGVVPAGTLRQVTRQRRRDFARPPADGFGREEGATRLTQVIDQRAKRGGRMTTLRAIQIVPGEQRAEILEDRQDMKRMRLTLLALSVLPASATSSIAASRTSIPERIGAPRVRPYYWES